MEISFWQFLAKEPDADALPLKQRIPEVALFRGCSLYAGFFSNQRGLLQKRSTTQYSKQFLLDRLLALSAKTADATDLCARTPAAILRRPQKPGMAGPPKTQVLNASQLMELLERTERGSMPGTFGLPAAVPQLEEDEDWSLQSLIVPQTNLRVVSVYSREANGEECLDLVGQPFSQVYPIDGPEPPAPPPAGPPRDPSLRSVFIPEAFASQVEMKSRHLAAYVQRFHGRALASLISEFIPDESGKAVLHGFWKVELLEGKSMAQSYARHVEARDFGLESPLPSTAVPSTVDSHTSRPTSASWSAASRPVSAQEDPSQVAANAARRAMSEDLHIQEDDTEDNELEEAIERMRASEPSGPRRAARCGRTMPGVDEATAAPAATGAGSLPTPTPSSVPAAQMPPRPSSGSRPNTERTMGADDLAARTASLSSRIRPRSAEQRSVRSAPASSRPSSARSVPSAARGPRNWSVQSSSFSARVVGQIRCDQLISRHLPEREARLKMISVLARQLERLRDHIPAFAQQWQTVEAFIETCQQRVSDKVKEVERSEEEIQRLQQLHSRQYDLLVQHLQRQVEEAKSAWKSRRRHLEACKQEEYELHQKVVAKEQQTQAVKSALDKTWRRMEEMQRSVSEKRTTLEARANGDWSRDLDDGDGTCRQMAEEINRHMQVRQEVSSYRSQIQAALEVLAQQRAYSLQLEDFIRKISGGGGRYVLPLPLKREAQRHMKAAAKQHKEAATLSEAF